ncbi:hypothetical protein [Nocardia brasiliensis]|uniref:hypothetical protein n=1 Tax=Nocardia brasiliensis TaxID=37326 RepID=UPI0032AF8FAE
MIKIADLKKKTPAIAISVPVGPNPISIGFSRRTGAASGWTRGFVANHGGSTVSVVDPDNPDSGNVLTIEVGSRPRQVLAARDGCRMYVANSADSTVSVIEVPDIPPEDAKGYLVHTISVGPNPRAMAVSPSGRWICVTCEGNNTATVLDTDADHDTNGPEDIVAGQVTVGACPWQVAADPRTEGRFYVLNYADATIDVIDATAVDQTVHVQTSSTISLPDNPTGITFAPDATRAYITHNTLDEISVINLVLNTKTATLPLPPAEPERLPSDIVIHPTGTRLYLTTDTLELLTVTTPSPTDTILHTAEASVGRTCTGMACHPSGHQLYLTTGDDTLEIFDITNTGADDKPAAAIRTATVTVSATDASHNPTTAVQPQHPSVTSTDLIVIPDQHSGLFTRTTSIDAAPAFIRSAGTPGPHHSAYTAATHLTAVTNPADNTLGLHIATHIHATATLHPDKPSNPAYTTTHITNVQGTTLLSGNKPTSIAYGDSTLYITDPTNRKIHSYTTSGTALAPATDHDCGSGLTPHLLTTTHDGNHLYITNKEGGGIHHFGIHTDGTLTYHNTYATGGQLTSITSTADNKSLLATDTGGTIVWFKVGADGDITDYGYPGISNQKIALTAIACSPTNPSVCCGIDKDHNLHLLNYTGSSTVNVLASYTGPFTPDKAYPPSITLTPQDGVYITGQGARQIDGFRIIAGQQPTLSKNNSISLDGAPTALTALDNDYLLVADIDSNGKPRAYRQHVAGTTDVFYQGTLAPSDAQFVQVEQVGDYAYVMTPTSLAVYKPANGSLGKPVEPHIYDPWYIDKGDKYRWAGFAVSPDGTKAFCVANLIEGGDHVLVSETTPHALAEGTGGWPFAWKKLDEPYLSKGLYGYRIVAQDNNTAFLLGDAGNPKGHKLVELTIGADTNVKTTEIQLPNGLFPISLEIVGDALLLANEQAVHVYNRKDWQKITTNTAAWTAVAATTINHIKLWRDNRFWIICKDASGSYHSSLHGLDGNTVTAAPNIGAHMVDIAGPRTGNTNDWRYCVHGPNPDHKDGFALGPVHDSKSVPYILDNAVFSLANSGHMTFIPEDTQIDLFWDISDDLPKSKHSSHPVNSKWSPSAVSSVSGWLFCVDVDGRKLRALSRGSGGGLVDNSVVVGVVGVASLVAARVNPKKGSKEVWVYVMVDGRIQLFTFDGGASKWGGGVSASADASSVDFSKLGPVGMACSPAGNFLYVGAGTAVVGFGVDPGSGLLVHSGHLDCSVDGVVEGLGMSVDGARLWVWQHVTDTAGELMVFDHDPASGAKTRSATTAFTGKAPAPEHGLVAGGDTDSTYVLTEASVMVGSAAKAPAPAVIQGGVCWGGVLYAGCGDGDVLVYDLGQDPDLGKAPVLAVNAPDAYALAAHPSGFTLYAVDHNGQRLRTFNIRDVAAKAPHLFLTVSTPGSHGTCVAATSTYVFVATDEKGIAVFDISSDSLTPKPLGRVVGSESVSRLAVSLDGSRLYTVHTGETRVTMYTITSGPGQLPGLSGPTYIDWQPKDHAVALAGIGVLDKDWLLVTDKQLDLHLIRTPATGAPVWYSTTAITGVTGTDPGTDSTPIPHTDSTTKAIYVTAPKATPPAVVRLTLTTTDGHHGLTQLCTPIPVGLMPTAVAASPTTGNIYTTNTGDNTVSVLVPTPVEVKTADPKNPIKGIDWKTSLTSLDSADKASHGPVGAGSYLYLLEGETGHDLKIIDTSGLTEKHTGLTISRSVPGMFADDTYALASDNRRLATLHANSIQLLDVTGQYALSPRSAATVLQGQVHATNGCGIALSPRFLCISDSPTTGSKRIVVAGLDNTAGTATIWAYATVSSQYRLALTGDLLYAAGPGTTIDVYDLSTLKSPGAGNPTEIKPAYSTETHDKHTYTGICIHAGYLYTAGNNTSDGIDIYDITGNHRTRPQYLTTANPNPQNNIAISQITGHGPYLFVNDQNPHARSLHVYHIPYRRMNTDLTDGIGTQPTAITCTHNGLVAVANTASNNISLFPDAHPTINPDGTETPLTVYNKATITTGKHPTAITAHPTQPHIYIANRADNTLTTLDTTTYNTIDHHPTNHDPRTITTITTP